MTTWTRRMWGDVDLAQETPPADGDGYRVEVLTHRIYTAHGEWWLACSGREMYVGLVKAPVPRPVTCLACVAQAGP